MTQGSDISLSEEIQKQLTKKRFELIRGMFNSMSPFDIASALESSSPNNRRILWELVDFNVEGEVLNELSIEVREFFLSSMDTTEVAQVTENLEADEIERIEKHNLDDMRFLYWRNSKLDFSDPESLINSLEK